MTAPDGWDAIVEAGRELAAAGLTPGTTGNISILQGESALTSGTGTRLGRLSDTDWARVSLAGDHLEGMRPTKESAFHVQIYGRRPDVGAVVHLHSPAALTVSCLADLAEVEPLPTYTPYYAMRVRGLAVVGYFPPGDTGLAGAVAHALESHDAVLLRRHGLVTVGADLGEAMAAAEELETNCALHLRLAGLPADPLSEDEIAHLRRTF